MNTPHSFVQNFSLFNKIQPASKGFTFYFFFALSLAPSLSSKMTSVEICAVLFNMAETEQYLLSERLTACSAAVRDTFPVIV